MQRFAKLYDSLDSTTKTNQKITAIIRYLEGCPPKDAAWGLYFLCGSRFKRSVSHKSLRLWAAEATGLSPWLFEECYATVGDLAETIALLVQNLPHQATPVAERSLASLAEQVVQPLKEKSEAEQQQVVLSLWSTFRGTELFLINKMLTGALRVGVSRKLVAKAVGKMTGISEAELAHRLMGGLKPTQEFVETLMSPEQQGERPPSQPYPFYLAYPLEAKDRVKLGPREAWQVEWKWDGIRGQLIHRQQEIYLWSRGEELVTDQFPELHKAGLTGLPEGVFDGELLVQREGQPGLFAELQRRLGRKAPGPKIQKEFPVGFFIYDLLEYQGHDLRHLPLRERRQQLEQVPLSDPFYLAPVLTESSFDELDRLRQQARLHRAEGLMLKALEGVYKTGRKRGEWWKWKTDPMTLDTVLLYAQAGHGRRANLFTDYTLGVWDGDTLVPIAKAYSGLTDEEFTRLDRWIKRNTEEKFGPVRKVKLGQVIELAFEGISVSSRHKSGIALRFPRIARWREDKPVSEADTLVGAKKLLLETSVSIPTETPLENSKR